MTAKQITIRELFDKATHYAARKGVSKTSVLVAHELRNVNFRHHFRKGHAPTAYTVQRMLKLGNTVYGKAVRLEVVDAHGSKIIASLT